MSSKAVLIGLVGDIKFFYLLTPTENGKDAALLRPDGSLDYVDFFSFVSKTPKITELRFTDFHRFLWEPQEGDEEDRWNRIFVNRTQPVTQNLLVGVEVVPDLGAKKTKTALLDRGEYFLRLTRSSGSESAHPLFLSRKSLSSVREVTGKALGRSLVSQRGVDGDGDGFVDDGLPTMRPFIPGFDILPDEVTARSSAVPGSRSLRTNAADTVQDRSLDAKQIQQVMDDVETAASVLFHDGKDIRTKQHAINALSRAIPSFSPKARFKSKIDFLKPLNDGDELEEWQKKYIAQFLMTVGTHPLRNDVIYEVREIGQGVLGEISGSTSPRPSSRGWVPFSPTSKLYVPRDPRPGKLVITYRGPESDWANEKVVRSILGRPDTRNFNILSSALDSITKQTMDDLSNNGDIDQGFVSLKGLQLDVAKQSEKIRARLRNATIVPLDAPEAAGIVQWIMERRDVLADIAQRFPNIATNVDPPGRLEMMTLAVDRDTQGIASQLDRLIALISDVENDPSIGRFKRSYEELRQQVGERDLFTTGVHEGTHVLEMLGANERFLKKADELRRKYIETAVQRELAAKGINPGQPNSRKVIEAIRKSIETKAPPREGFFLEVFKEQVASYATSDPDGFKRRLLAYGFEDGLLPGHSNSVSFIPFFQVMDITLNSYGAIQQLVRNNTSTLTRDIQDAKQFLQNVDGFFLQQLSLDGAPLAISPELSRVLTKGIQMLSNSGARLLPPSGGTQPGDPLTMGHIVTLLGSLLPSQVSRHTSFRGLDHEQILDNPLTILGEMGFPDIRPDRTERAIRGFAPEDAPELLDGIIAAAAVVGKYDQQRAFTTDPRALFAVRQIPGEVLLPPEFGGISYSEFMKLSPDTLAQATKESIDNIAEKIVELDATLNTNNAQYLFDLPRYVNGELDDFSPQEINKLLEITGKVGLPTGRPRDPSYTSYQATLLPRKLQLSPSPFMLFEFAAETGLAELFQLALSQVNPSGLDTRSLDNDELQLLNRFFRFIFQAGFPRDILERVYA